MTYDLYLNKAVKCFKKSISLLSYFIPTYVLWNIISVENCAGLLVESLNSLMTEPQF